ncbi:tetratricopeptide repeat protein [Acidobacteriota bacterium]
MRKARKNVFILSFILFFLTLSSLSSQTEVLEKAKESVVSFVVLNENKEEIGRGSGFVMDAGFLATSYNPVSQAQDVQGLNFKGKKVKFDGIVTVDRNFNIALLKIKGKTPALALGDSDQLGNGKKVFAIGGRASGEIAILEGTVKNILEISPTQRIVDTDLNASSSFAGAPVLDSNGQVLGMIVFIEGRTDVVIPSNILQKMPKQSTATKFQDWKPENYLSTLEGSSLAGRTFSALNDSNKALKYLRQVASLKPNDVEVQAILASIYTKQRNFSAAVSAYKKILELDPDRPRAQFDLGKIYIAMRRWEDAIPPLEKTAQASPDNLDAYLLIGTAQEQLKAWDKAAEAYEKFLSSEPPDAWEIWYRLGTCNTRLRQFDKAATAFQQALKEKPDDIKITSDLAETYQKAKQYDKAAEVFAHLAEIKPENSESFYSIIIRMFDEAKMPAKAIEAAKKMIELNPDSDSAVYNLGLMHMRLENFSEAAEAFKRAAEMRPDYDYAWFNLGFSLNKLKRYQEAGDAFKKYVELSPENADAWFFIGISYLMRKMFESSIAPLQKAIQLKPDHAMAIYNLAISFINLQDYFSAEQLQKKLASVNPELAARLRKLL